ncbi:calcium-binding protein [Actinoplanes couchii]|uniref:Hemolysin-type calcium-binding region n=2 Tax=Actinoplanes couchii TaxID=403638 RepID=A0ABQ3X8A9_9ACTN|nr:calcium-binding protein [Actinoplanes couchii]GID54734.1 hypothetical protein Aco03nite_031380 [Actinoplanes couchii]
MFDTYLKKNLKKIAAIGATAMVTTVFLASPAQAATAAKAEVSGKNSTVVRFTAGAGQNNNLRITVSGRTVTLNDQVAIKAGKGCKPVKGDKTKVKCTTSRTPTELVVKLGDQNDLLNNGSAVPMSAWGGAGADAMSGGTGRDRIYGGAGNDDILGSKGADLLDGGAGDDVLYGFEGNDRLLGGPGFDILYGMTGNDTLIGGTGPDWLYGGSGNDALYGNAGDDKLEGDSGKDKLVGGAGKDEVKQ